MRDYGADDLALLAAVLDVGKLSRLEDGMVRRLGREFADRVGSRFAVPRNANLTALSQALALAGIGREDEVICDPLVQYGGIAALSVGAMPVFVDIRPDTYNMDERLLEPAIGPRTRAVIVTHMWGLCADMPVIAEICRRRGLFLVEDCAHSLGSRWGGVHAGTFGDVGVFSLHHNKQLSTGDGGVLVTDHEWIHDLLHNEWPSGESPEFLTLDYHMNELTAAVGVAQLARVDSYLAAYDSSLLALDAAVAGVPWLRPRSVPVEADPSPYWWAALWCGDDHGLDFAAFKRAVEAVPDGAECNFTEHPAPEWPIFVKAGVPAPDLPVAADILSRVVHMPVIELPVERAVEVGRGLRRIGDDLAAGRRR